jgi:hypothetical protein
MRLLKWIVPFAFVGCTHLRSLSVTTIPEDRSRPVSAAGERVIFFGINQDNEYAASLVKDLAAQCPGGTVSGILTRLETNIVFPFVVTMRVHAQGYCVMPGAESE